MKKIMKVIVRLGVLIAIGGMAAGIKDIQEQKKSKHKPYGSYEKYFKRPLDFIISTWTLILLSPVIVVVAILVKVKLGGPVLFKQERPGKNEKVFTLWKFKTMTDEKGEDGELLSDDLRVTPFGKILRSSSLDELPELVNIIKGDMAIVGPRPLLVRYLPYFYEKERVRHDVRPGLTGLAQSNGRNNLSWEDRFQYDVAYVNRITFMGDVGIVLRTIKKVLKEEDIVVSGTVGSILDLDAERGMKYRED